MKRNMMTSSNANNKRNTRYKDFINNSELLLLCAPAIVLFIIFSYLPMAGLFLAFKNYRYDKGILGSDWCGFDNFKFFFNSQDAWMITRNTLGLNALFIIVGLVFSVGFALMLNEITKKVFVKFYQTVMFFPYFLSWVVVSYMLYSFLSPEYGIINNVLKNFSFESLKWYTTPAYWPAILTFASIWKSVGYTSVIYYASIMGIDSEYYEAASIDGANRFQTVTKITVPMLTPIITITVLLQIGKIFYADFGMFYFLPMDIGTLFPVTQVIDTYVFRALRVTGDIGMATAAGFFQSIVGFLLILVANYTVKKISSENSIF